jgi:hypothetical protein
MKSTLMKTALAMLTLSTLLTATCVQADWASTGYGHDRNGLAIQQSRMFGQQINARRDRQIERIRAGMQEGRLTRMEFRELMHEQREIRAMERHFRADGYIDAREFQRLDRALDIASRNIRAEKHDRHGQYAYNASPWFY